MRSIRDVLARVRKGSLTVGEAEKILRLDAIAIVDEIARLDVKRYLRRGVPEVVYAAGKSNEHLLSIVKKLLDERNRTRARVPIILSKVKENQIEYLNDKLEKQKRSLLKKVKMVYYKEANMVVFQQQEQAASAQGGVGRVALLAAGTSDISALNESEIILNTLGCETIRFNDVGVSALHRLASPLKKVFSFDPDAIIVAAGMEGALPSVIAGLSDVPVIGLPTSIGYGYGKNGEAALMGMLQACPLGVSVVNIDGGVSAGIIAYLVAKRSSKRH